MKKYLLFALSFIITTSLCQAQTLTLWGLAPSGGTNGQGVIFNFNTATDKETVAHNFAPGPGGGEPTGSLIRASDGLLYGMSSNGVTQDSGAIFSYDVSTGTETTLHDFGGATDGSNPHGSLMQASNGLLYGMTEGGGTNNFSGTIFSYNISTGKEIKLHDFGSGTDGTDPLGSLIQASNGLLYGMTLFGGVNDKGMIFSYNLSTGVETDLHDFNSDSGGVIPNGALLQASNGLLYGVNIGALFSYNITSGTYTTLHTFGSGTDGHIGIGSLIQASNGLLYGMTEFGTLSNGTIYSYDISDGSYNKLYDFKGTDGSVPQSSLIQASDGLLYGMTSEGGTGTSNAGIIFSFNISTGKETVLFDFGGNLHGGFPGGDLLEVDLNSQFPTDTAGAGYALKFTDSNGSYVDVGDNLNSLKFPFTIESWINLSGYPNVEGSIFSSDNTSVYSGFWLNVNHAGNLFIEFGDNVSSGLQDRRGIQTTTVLPLHKWVHVAAVCNSITDVQLYFNGVLQNSNPTDGASGATTMFHNFGNAEIGDWLSASRETPFLGQIDELRIWKIARTINEIQQHMCSRVTPIGALVGYWRGAGPLSGPAVTDFSNESHNGTIVGGMKAVTKVVSGAPVGDYSKALYGPLAKRFIALADPSGDSFKVSLATGNPFGVSVYGVDEAPHRTYGLSEFPSHYFGVFCAESTDTAVFRISYHYSNATLNGNPETEARIFEKETDSSTHWIATGRKPDTTDNLIIKTRRTSRDEFILSFINSPALLTQPIMGASGELFIFPNPAHSYLTISFMNLREPVNVIRIMNLTGEVIREIQNPSNSSSLNLDIANWSSGIYFAEAITAKGNYSARFIIQ